ncbi:MAG: U32 family peptidase [Deltaproteobacteria bacterium]|nr:U32 family peptidase [Deltaproteobacteria bacterium]TLN03897.1 MAG: U32 family peptidase [bacterium]
MIENADKIRKPELLAPAGSLEAFFAAMEKGADAVYAGLTEFSARAKAKNFSLPQMEKIVAYAHSQQRKVYVTLNTLVKEQELPKLVEVLSALSGIEPDGVILQDMAVYRLIREHFPDLPLHASTQMTIHNSLGVQELESLGFSRVVLARELHIDEIRTIARKTEVELECFIHGALCFSFSGQCYFSSFLGGSSGNRGRCAQPCRRLYRYRGKEGYYFSPNDFSSIDMLPELVEAGVSSFKIEGRMKSAEYVASVVGAYRMVLDAPAAKRADAVAEAKELLKLSFGRVPTRGFLASHQPTDIAIPSLRGATGRYLGEIRSIQKNRITFETKDRLHLGDRVRVQPKSDKAGKAFTVKDITLGGKPVKVAREKSLITVTAPFAFAVGDAVFKVSSETAFTMSENACLRKLSGIKGQKTRCNLALALNGENLRITARAAGLEWVAEYPLGTLEPSRSADMAGVLRAQFEKCGDTPFTLGTLSAPAFPAVLIPLPKLKEIRRSLYQTLEEKVLGGKKERLRRAKEAALASLIGPGHAPAERRDELSVRVESIRDFHLVHQEGVDTLILPVSKANLHQLQAFAGKLRGRQEKIIWHLPFIIFEADLPFYREAIKLLVEHGFNRFEAANLSHFALLHGLAVEICCDYRLYSLNSQALRHWQERGATAATLYLEDDFPNLESLLRANLDIERRVLLFAPVPVITSKIVIKGVRSDSPLVSDRGDAYTVSSRDGLTTVTADRRFAISGYRRRLRESGCSSFIADLSGEAGEARKRVLEACIRGTAIEGTSEFNFTTELL